MDIQEIRKEIDRVDDQFVKLFNERMHLSSQIAEVKREQDLPVLNVRREREILNEVAAKSDPELANYSQVLYSLIFELSRSYQEKLLKTESELHKKISRAIGETPALFPQSAHVACQGVEGAYSQLACERIFKNPNIVYFKNFEGVFSAIESGFCQYGILPIENSTAGSVKKVYDLMISHNFSVVRSVRLKVDHNLLAKRGTKLGEIREIFSHEQAINQCADFLQTLPGVKVTQVENTAVASELVASSDRNDVAALSSRACAELYGLEVLRPSVQDEGNNRTRFLCISRNLEIYPGADKTSIMLVAPHKPGALYKILARLYVLGINVTKLESRPIPDRDFEFMFYLDLETSIYSEEFVQLMCELDGMCEEFTYLGSYSEVV